MNEELSKMDLSSPPVEDLEEKKQEEEKDDEEKTPGEYLQQFPDAPTDQTLEVWKQKFGEVLCSKLGDTEFFMFRPITRDEFVNLQALIVQLGNVSNFEIEVKIVETCVLWSSPAGQEALEKKAGTYSTLHEQILMFSNFMNSALVGNCVIKL
jgi:hypothetical protein